MCYCFVMCVCFSMCCSAFVVLLSWRAQCISWIVSILLLAYRTVPCWLVEIRTILWELSLLKALHIPNSWNRYSIWVWAKMTLWPCLSTFLVTYVLLMRCINWQETLSSDTWMFLWCHISKLMFPLHWQILRAVPVGSWRVSVFIWVQEDFSV